MFYIFQFVGIWTLLFFSFCECLNFDDARNFRNEALKLKDARNFDGAVEKLIEALKIVKSSIEVEKDTKEKAKSVSYYAQVLHDMGICLTSGNRYTEAIPVLQEVLDIYMNTFGESHATYSLAARSLAEVYIKLGKYKDALKLYEALQLRIVKGLGDSHEAYIEASNKIGECHYNLGNYGASEESYRKVTSRIDELGENTMGVAESFLGVSQSLAQIGKLKDALSMASKASELFALRSGKNSVDYAVSLNGKAGILSFQGKNKQALKLVEKAYRIVDKLFGANNPMVKEAKQHIRILKKRIQENQQKSTSSSSEKDEL